MGSSMTIEERYHTLTEVATMLNVSRETLRRWIHRKKLPAVRVTDRVWRIHPKHVRILAGGETLPKKNVAQLKTVLQSRRTDEGHKSEVQMPT